MRAAALILCCALALLPLGCGGDNDGADSDERILQEALHDFGKPTVVLLDTAALGRAARAGEPIALPFARSAADGGGIVDREVQLTLRNLRNPELTEFVLKDGDAGTGSAMPLPPPATYQGKVQNGGAAVFTINDTIVEGSMLVAPDGWSFIEPLEPQLRLNGVELGARQRLLSKYNHIVYNTRDALASRPGPDEPSGSSVPPGPPAEPEPLVMSMVADGDAALFRAYPLDSVMPFWLKQESLLNAVDWLYNCVEPDANAENAYADCDNDFDGGFNNFQARVRIDRLEVWTTGGPDSDLRAELLKESTVMTHQASPLCCGEPHTAGRSNLVHFLSGRDLADGAGFAAGEGGLNYYGERCRADGGFLFLCHHAVSQIVSGHDFRGTAFYQQMLVAHEIGHNNLAREAFAGDSACWLFGEECGSSVMSSNPFSSKSLFLYTLIDSEPMGRLLADQLGTEP